MNEPDDYEEEDFEAMAEPAKITTDGITIEIKAHALDAIANAAASQIVSRLEDKVLQMVDARLDILLNDAWRDGITARAQKLVDEFLDKPRHPTNQYGETLHGRPAMTFSERIPETVNAWLLERVDGKGARFEARYNSSDKGASRIDWMIAQLVTANLKNETEKAAKEVTEAARKVVANHVGRFISEQMVPAIDVARVT